MVEIEKKIVQKVPKILKKKEGIFVLKRSENPMREKCQWQQVEEGQLCFAFITSCANQIFIYDTQNMQDIREELFKFCPYCSEEIEEINDE
jgi:hypothetical protein